MTGPCNVNVEPCNKMCVYDVTVANFVNYSLHEARL